jgi:hypothetical protein
MTINTKKRAGFFSIPHMHCPSVTIFVVLTFQASARFCPIAVSHNFKAVIPHIKKIIPVNIALYKIAVDVWTCRY